MRLIGFIIFSVFFYCEADRWRFRPSKNDDRTNVIYCSGSDDSPHSNQSEFSNWQTEDQIERVLNVSRVTDLKINGCGMDFVNDNLKSYQRLAELHVSYLRYDITLQLKNIIYFNRLVTLNESHNELSSISSTLFSEFSELSTVDFSHNLFMKIESFTFSSGKKLVNIFFSNNQVFFIDAKAFVGLSRLKFVDLRSNSITTIEFTFPNNFRVKVLHLEENQIRNVSCSFFSLINSWTSVHISWKYVYLLQTNCFSDKLRIIPNSNFEGVLMGHGSVELHCNENAFENVHSFNIGRDKNENIHEIIPCIGANLKRIDFSGCFIGEFNKTAFSRFDKLNTLILSGDLLEFDFKFVPMGLKQLDISNNYKIALYNIPFLEHLHLITLSIAENHLENTMEILEHLNAGIKEIDLSGNHLDFKAESFAKFGHVQTLWLKNVHLQNMKVNVFESLHSLKELDISQNDLEKFDFELISKTLKKLQHLVASNCNIKNVLRLLEYLNKGIKYLDFSGNFIGAVNATTFEGFNFEKLSLANTNLWSFDFATIQRHTRLKFLDVSHNHLKNVDFNLMPRQSLEKLYLHGNELTELTNFDQSRFPNVARLTIFDNNFSCKFLASFLPNYIDEDDWEISLQQKHGIDCSPFLQFYGKKSKTIATTAQTEASTSLITSPEAQIAAMNKKSPESVSKALPWYMYIVIIGSSFALYPIMSFVISFIRKRTWRSANRYAYDEPAVVFKRDEPQLPDLPARLPRAVVVQPDHADVVDQEGVYAEIGPPNAQAYDQLEFDFSAQPIPENDEHYRHLRVQAQVADGARVNANAALPYDHLEFGVNAQPIDADSHYHNYLLKNQQQNLEQNPAQNPDQNPNDRL